MSVEEAQNALWRATVLVEQGKAIEAMRAIGMDLEMLSEVTMTEATEIFQVRYHDLISLIKGDSE
jgi:hypothetical protein